MNEDADAHAQESEDIETAPQIIGLRCCFACEFMIAIDVNLTAE